MWNAWWLLMGAPHIEVAVAHKTLHHKRPEVFPLIDRLTAPVLGENAWRKIWDDLDADPGTWAALERALASAAARHDDAVALTRLRLHDILLWCRTAPDVDEDDLLRAGREYRG